MLEIFPHAGNLQVLLFVIISMHTDCIGPNPSCFSTMLKLLKRCRGIEDDWKDMTIATNIYSPFEVIPNVRCLVCILQSPEGSNCEMAFQDVVGVAWMQH